MTRQVYEFLGVLAPKTTLFLTRSKAASVAQMSADMIAPLSPKVGKLLTPKSMAGGNSGWPCWRASRVQTVARKVCHEISSTIDPLTMAYCVRSNLQRDSALSGLFCFSAWLAPFIPDYAEIGAYSKHVSSQIYQHAAERMPKLILEAAFGNVEVTQSMRKFMAQWMASDLNVSNGDLELLDQISTKDRGPFLYWLINERRPSVLPRTVWPLLCLVPLRRSLSSTCTVLHPALQCCSMLYGVASRFAVLQHVVRCRSTVRHGRCNPFCHRG